MQDYRALVLEYFDHNEFSYPSIHSLCESFNPAENFEKYRYPFTKGLESVAIQHFPMLKSFDQVLQTTFDGELSPIQSDILKTLAYLALCHMKYGASYDQVTANRLYGIIQKLSPALYETLKVDNTTQNEQITFQYNEYFATIHIIFHQTDENALKAALIAINQLLATKEFPKSYQLTFEIESGAEFATLPIDDLPICAPHQLFAEAVKYPALHPLMVEYIQLAQHKWHGYNNPELEDPCAMPSTFAVFALALFDEQYFDITLRYFKNSDDEHQCIQMLFTPVFMEKYGVTKESIRVYIQCILSMQEHEHFPLFAELFSTDEAKVLLENSRQNMREYYFTDEDWEDMSLETDEEINELLAYMWDSVLYTTYNQTEFN